MKTDIYQFKEWQNDARRELNNEIDELSEKKERLDNYMHALDMTDKLLDEIDDLLAENERLKEDMEQLQAENEDLHQQLEDKDLKLNELGKFSVNMAKKSPQEGLEKAIRMYLNISKRKTQAKREVAKFQLLDFIATAKLEMPEDIMEQLNHLDDEQPIITSQSNTYNAPVGQVVEHTDKIVSNV